jgi:hypothetical protein
MREKMVLKMLVNLFQVTIIALSVGCEKPQPPKTDPVSTPTTPPVNMGELTRGFTLDNVENISGIVKSIKAMPFKPSVRIVFDFPEKPSSYRDAVESICQIAICLGQPSDSVYSGKMSVAQFKQRFKEYVDAFPIINYWETCNECNGDWAGKNTPAQTDEALKIVKAAGKKSVFVPYWNTKTCADKHGDYYEWTVKNISAYVKAETDIVALSVYGFDCDGGEPSHSVLDGELNKFKTLFPNASIQIGEYGKQNSSQVMRHYLSYNRVGFGGYWHGTQDLINTSGAMWKEFVK